MEQIRRLIFRLLRSFFGLPDDYRISVLNEEIFQLLYYMKGGFTYTDIWNMTTFERKSFLRRLERQFKKEKEEMEKATKKK